MLKRFTYPEGRPMKWLSILLVSLSCFAFSLSPVPVDAGRDLPFQIEQVVSDRGDDNQPAISLQKFVFEASPLFSANQSRDHEKNILLTYQKEVQVHFESTSNSILSFLQPKHFRLLKIISDDSDEGFPPLSLA